MSSTRSKLMLLTGRRFLPVELPGFPPLRVRSLNEGERAIVESFAKSRMLKRIIVALSLCELETDTQVFPTTDETSVLAVVEELAKIDGVVIDKIVSAALPLNQISESDIRSLLGELAAN